MNAFVSPGKRALRALLPLVVAFAACGSPPPRFPLEPRLAKDTDLAPVNAECHTEEAKGDPHHVACTPEVYVSPLAWDGANQMLFRPLARVFAVDPSGEAVNVTADDEVLDSAWFTNRVGAREVSDDELTRGGCKPSQMLDPEVVPDGGWLIDKGKADGATPGFRVTIPGKGKFMFKVDADVGGDLIAGEITPHRERPTAASVIGAAAYQAAGFYTSCEQVLYVKRSIFTLKPGLVTRNNAGVERKFDQAALDKVLAATTPKGDLLRLTASAWLPGHLLGPFRYEGTRGDDPNDVIDHQDRRELRGARVLAAWLDHFDSREQNSMDSWITADKDAPEDSSPGYVRHYYLDTSDCLGSEWAWEPISRRLGHSFVVDWADMGRDFVTLGIPTRPWEEVSRTPGHIKFGFYDLVTFDPELWKNEYPNAAFTRMSEHDGAWMARILAHLTPKMVRTLAEMGKFSDPGDTDFITYMMEGRLQKILERYLTRLSPITHVHVARAPAEAKDELCAVDLIEKRGLRNPEAFRYTAARLGGPWLEVTRKPGGELCVALPRIAGDGGSSDDAESRYTKVLIHDGVASGGLLVSLYDLGPTRGYRVAGVERPAP